MESKPLTVRLPEDLHVWLVSESAHSGMTRTDLVVQALTLLRSRRRKAAQ